MKRTFFRLIASLLLLVFLLNLVIPVQAQTPAPVNPVYIYFFWGEGCPHCAKAKPYFEYLALTYPEIELKSYEVYYDADGQKLFTSMLQKFDIEQFAVPTIFIGPYYLQGYSEEANGAIEKVVLQCAKEGCIDAGLGLVLVKTQDAPTPTLSESPTPSLTPAITTTQTPVAAKIAVPSVTDIDPFTGATSLNDSRELTIPLLGKVSLDSKSTVFSTALIALVDGFNPCSIWVLTMLLALTLHTGSRKKVFVIGFIFLSVTAGIYALFIVGLFSVLKYASFLGWIRVLVALIALTFALINIKDYFWYKEGVSLTISEAKKPGIFKKLRAVIDASQSFGGLVVATVTLAAGVSMVEFACTAGFPVIWTNILTSQNVNGSAFVLLLLLYMLIYQLDEMVIFFASVATLKTSRMEEKHGRILKLISGMLMLTLSLVMLINPALLSDLSSSLVIFGIAFFATVGVFVIHRYLLPKFGISIGSNNSDKSQK